MAASRDNRGMLFRRERNLAFLNKVREVAAHEFRVSAVEGHGIGIGAFGDEAGHLPPCLVECEGHRPHFPRAFEVDFHLHFSGGNLVAFDDLQAGGGAEWLVGRIDRGSEAGEQGGFGGAVG